MSAAVLPWCCPTPAPGLPPEPAQVLAHACEVVRAAPAGAERRACLWACRRAILSTAADNLDRESAFAELRRAAAAVAVDGCDFEQLADSAAEIVRAS